MIGYVTTAQQLAEGAMNRLSPASYLGCRLRLLELQQIFVSMSLGENAG
jgi:hypothetical protein